MRMPEYIVAYASVALEDLFARFPSPTNVVGRIYKVFDARLRDGAACKESFMSAHTALPLRASSSYPLSIR